MTAKQINNRHVFEVPFRDIGMRGEMFSAAYIIHAEEALARFWDQREPLDTDPAFYVSKVSCNSAGRALWRSDRNHRAGQQDRRALRRLFHPHAPGCGTGGGGRNHLERLRPAKRRPGTASRRPA